MNPGFLLDAVACALAQHAAHDAADEAAGAGRIGTAVAVLALRLGLLRLPPDRRWWRGACGRSSSELAVGAAATISVSSALCCSLLR